MVSRAVCHQLNVCSFYQVLHGFAEDGVIHEFEEVFFKRVGGFLALRGCGLCRYVAAHYLVIYVFVV